MLKYKDMNDIEKDCKDQFEKSCMFFYQCIEANEHDKAQSWKVAAHAYAHILRGLGILPIWNKEKHVAEYRKLQF